MRIRRYLFLIFILLFAWNGKKRGPKKSKKILSAIAFFENSHRETKELHGQMNEIEEYNLRIYKISFFLFEIFKSLRIDLQKTESGLPIENKNLGHDKILKQINKEKELVILIKSFEESFKSVYEDLKQINKKITHKRKGKLSSIHYLEYASQIFSDNLALTRDLARLTLARSLLYSHPRTTIDNLSLLFKEARERVGKKLTQNKKPIKDLKKTINTCYDLDTATIFAPQTIARLKLLTREYNKLLAKDKRASLKIIMQEQEAHTQRIDQLEGCLKAYFDIYTEMTTLKVSRINKFISSKPFQLRKNHLKQKLTNIASEENDIRDKSLEQSLISYFEKKSKKNKKRGFKRKIQGLFY